MDSNDSVEYNNKDLKKKEIKSNIFNKMSKAIN
jgi:hypothetical protein